MDISAFTEKLKGVAWSTLCHSYGSAEDVPEMVLGLLSPSAAIRRRSRTDLEHSLNHQGLQRWESTKRVTPFLLELLADSKTPERHLLIPILTDFAVGCADGVYLQTSFHIDEAYTPAFHAPMWKNAVVTAVCEGLKYGTNEVDVMDQALLLLRENFTSPGEPLRENEANRIITFESLSDAQRCILNTFASVPLVWRFSTVQDALNEYGLPPDQDRLQKFLAGLTPPHV
jgi:hypothetical protein